MSFVRHRFFVLLLAAHAVVLAACAPDSPGEAGAQPADSSTAPGADSTAVANPVVVPAALDSSGATPALQDSLQVGPPAGTTAQSQAQGSAQLPVPAETAATVPLAAAQQLSSAAIDSVRADIARLGASVATLTRTQDSLLSAMRPAAVIPAAGNVRTGQELITEAGARVRNYGARSFWALIVLILTTFSVRLLVAVLNTLSERSATRRLFYKRLVPIARILLWSFAVYFTIRVVFDVDYQGLIAAAAALGVAIGFAAQDILKNIFGGLVIVFDQPFQVGDKIKVGESYGEVVSIGLRSTRIVTPDDSTVTVPNAQVMDSQVSNANSGALDCQVVADLYLPGWVDEAKAKAIAYQVAASSKYAFLGKPIVVLVKDEF